MSDNAKMWRGIKCLSPHPDNGKGRGGSVVGSMIALLDCGHIRVYPKSKTPSTKMKVQCPACTDGMNTLRPSGRGKP